jgi:tRNA A-37 threonylcarbamoyl transferase component Bud32
LQTGLALQLLAYKYCCIEMNYQKIRISGYRLEFSDSFPAGTVFNSEGTGLFSDGQRSSFVKLPSSKFAKVFKFNVYLKGKIYSLILKQYLNRSFFDILKNSLRPCRAQRAFKAGQMLKRYGFFTPDVVAVGKKTFVGIATKNFLITSQVEDSVPLYKMLDIDISQKQQLIKQFGQTVGRMHAAGIFHGDLRLGNVLVKKDDNRFVFIFLDNERTRKFKKLPERLRLKNLVQINMSRENISDSDRMHFLDAYLAQQNIRLDGEKLAAQIAATVARRLAARGIKTV